MAEKKEKKELDWARAEARRSILKFLMYFEDYTRGRELHD